MNEPVTQLDERFSDLGSTAVPWAETEHILESADLFWISTVRKDGRPHVTPLVAVWHEDAMHFSTGPHEQKAVNLANDPHVVLTTGTNSWNSGLDVVIEGTARQVTNKAALEQLADAWAAKWDGRWQFHPSDGGFQHDPGGLALVFEVKPTKILAFSKGLFSHTRYLPQDDFHRDRPRQAVPSAETAHDGAPD